MCHQLPRQRLDDDAPIFFAGFDDLYQRRPSEARHAKEATAKRSTNLTLERSRITIPEHKSTGHSPLARLSCRFEHECVGGIKPYRAKKLQLRGPLVAASNQAGSPRRGRSFFFDTSTFPMRRINRSPSSSISRRIPCSGDILSRYLFATAPNPLSRHKSNVRIKFRAKLSRSWVDIVSVKPSSSSAVTNGFNPGSFPVMDTVRIMPPKTSQGGTSPSEALRGQAKRPPPTRPRLTNSESGHSIVTEVLGCARATSASARAAIPA